MNKLLAVRKFDILIANGNNKLLFNAPVDTVPSKYFYLVTRRPFCLREI